MSKDFMALMTPNHPALPIVRQGTLVYLTPTVIPHDRYSAPRTELEICRVMQEIDLTSLDSELRGISDVQDCQYDHLSKIADLIAAASGHQDFWKVREKDGRLVRHHIRKPTVFFDFSNVRGMTPINVSTLTGKRGTFKQYSAGSRRRLLMRISRSIPPDPGLIPRNGLERQHCSSRQGSIEKEASNCL